MYVVPFLLFSTVLMADVPYVSPSDSSPHDQEELFQQLHQSPSSGYEGHDMAPTKGPVNPSGTPPNDSEALFKEMQKSNPGH